jgi:hypothetical protein
MPILWSGLIVALERIQDAFSVTGSVEITDALSKKNLSSNQLKQKGDVTNCLGLITSSFTNLSMDMFKLKRFFN